MNDSKISVRYSRALFQSALEMNLLDNVNGDMSYISEICKIPEFKEFLDSQIIRPGVKSKTLKSVFENKVEGITMSLIDLAVKNGREKYLPAIARVFITDTLKHKGITECQLTTAVDVSAAINKEISDFISSKYKTKVVLRENIENEILGGFILRIEDKYIDASVRSRLRKIKKELLGKNVT